MCKRRKQVKQKVIQKRNTRVKRKRTCCQKCRRKIRNWLCKRIKRCIKNTVFGDPNPQLDGFEIAGINLGSVRDHLKINKSQKFLNKDKEINVENKSTLITLFKKNRDKSSKSIPFKNAIINEYDRYSISKSIGKKVKSFINDFKERNIFLGISKDSKLYLEKDEKEKFRNLAEKYEKKSVLFRSYENLKKRFHLTASKSVIFRKMLDDYKKGKVSFTDLINVQVIDVNNINSQDFKRLLAQYESQKRKSGVFDRKSRELSMNKKIHSKYKNFPIKNLELLRNMNSDELKNTFSLSDSKEKILGHMIDDYKKGKISLSAMGYDVRKNSQIINKEKLIQMLDYYKQNRSRHYPIVKQSKFKQFKSDLRAIGFL